jgi:hypothetical protein
MADKLVTLTIQGQPGADVRVFPQESEDVPQPPYSGRLDENGRLTLSLQPAFYSIISSAHETQPLELNGDSEEQEIQLKTK